MADVGYIPEIDMVHYSSHFELQRRPAGDKTLLRYGEAGVNGGLKFRHDGKTFKEWNSEIYTGGNLKGKFSCWSGYEFERSRIQNSDFDSSVFWTETDLELLRFINIGLSMRLGQNVWFDESDPGVAPFYNVHYSLHLRPGSFVDLDMDYKTEELKDYYFSKIYETDIKLQFSDRFWIKMIFQYYDTVISAYDYRERSFNIFPLLTYRPDADFSLYIGAHRGDFDQQISGIGYEDRTGTEYFIKLNYVFDFL